MADAASGTADTMGRGAGAPPKGLARQWSANRRAKVAPKGGGVPLDLADYRTERARHGSAGCSANGAPRVLTPMRRGDLKKEES